MKADKTFLQRLMAICLILAIACLICFFSKVLFELLKTGSIVENTAKFDKNLSVDYPIKSSNPPTNLNLQENEPTLKESGITLQENELILNQTKLTVQKDEKTLQENDLTKIKLHAIRDPFKSFKNISTEQSREKDNFISGNNIQDKSYKDLAEHVNYINIIQENSSINAIQNAVQKDSLGNIIKDKSSEKSEKIELSDHTIKNKTEGSQDELKKDKLNKGVVTYDDLRTEFQGQNALLYGTPCDFDPQIILPPFILKGIAIDAKTRKALIDSNTHSYIVDVGQKIEGWTIRDIIQGKVSISNEKGQYFNLTFKGVNLNDGKI